MKDSIKVVNTSQEPLTLYSSKEDFIAWDDSGTPKFVPLEDQVNGEYSMSNWIVIEDQNITLAPGESREINFSINIPNNAEPGGHYAAIFFSPWVPGGSQVAVVQRLWVLILVNVPGDVKIAGDVTKFELGTKEEKTFTPNTKFPTLPVVFQTTFENSGNIHLKPTGKITLVDEDGKTLKNVGKESLMSPSWAYLWERLVDYIPVNETLWNVLPKSSRKFETLWQGFGYSVLNDDGSKSVLFKDLTTYYKDNASEQAQFLMFWESIKSRKVEKKITAKFELSYASKDKNPKEFTQEKDFFVSYEEKYIGLNYYLLTLLLLLLIWGWYYGVKIYPEHKKQKEEALRKKILEEISKNNP